jgi:hypothetical protein
MGGFGTFLASIAWPIVSRVLASMGLGVISYVGLKAALDAAIGSAQGSMGGLAPEVAAILSISGGVTALSILSGGLVASVSLVALKRIGLKSGT